MCTLLFQLRLLALWSTSSWNPFSDDHFDREERNLLPADVPCSHVSLSYMVSVLEAPETFVDFRTLVPACGR